jgi:ComF family protein
LPFSKLLQGQTSNISLRALIPSPCIICGVCCQNEISLCDFCCTELPWIDKSCYTCGLPLPDSGLAANYCSKCLLNPPPFTFCRGIFHYQLPVNKLITQFKFHARTDIGFTLAELLAREFAKEYTDIPCPQFIVPVPLHRERLRSRGFNQALEICQSIRKTSGIPIAKNLVVKLKRTPPQTQLESAYHRKRNQRNAFFIAKGNNLKSVNHVAIIDDVVTTTATIRSLADTLLRHGVRRIDAWCIARAS